MPPDCTPTCTTTTIQASILSGTIPGTQGPPGPIGWPVLSRTITVTDLSQAKVYGLFLKDGGVIKEVRTIVTGSTPSVEWNLRHGANYNGVGTGLFAADVVSTDTATGNGWPTQASFATGGDVVAAGSHVWLTFDVANSDADAFHITVTYTSPAEQAVWIPYQYAAYATADQTGITTEATIAAAVERRDPTGWLSSSVFTPQVDGLVTPTIYGSLSETAGVADTVSIAYSVNSTTQAPKLQVRLAANAVHVPFAMVGTPFTVTAGQPVKFIITDVNTGTVTISGAHIMFWFEPDEVI